MRFRFLVGVVTLMATSLFAADVWKEKPYQDWSEKDVRKILNESPWAKRVEIETNEQSSAVRGGGEETSSGSEGGGDGEGSSGEKGRDEKRGSVVFMVRWVSSRTMREAWVRGEVLQKRIAAADTAKFLPPPSDDSQLVIAGGDMSAFAKEDENTLREKSILLRTKSKQKIRPSTVQVVRSPDGKKVRAIVFHFQKSLLLNKPTAATTDDHDLQFVIHTGTTEIKAGFDLERMVDNEGLDL